MAAFLVAVPTFQASETNEFDTAKERSEEVSLVERTVNLKRLTLQSCSVHAPITSDPFGLGHSLRQVFSVQSGHRLSNGLMAPMTC